MHLKCMRSSHALVLQFNLMCGQVGLPIQCNGYEQYINILFIIVIGSTAHINSIMFLLACNVTALQLMPAEQEVILFFNMLHWKFCLFLLTGNSLLSGVCAAESTNGAAQVHVAGQIWSSLAWHLMLWGLNAHNLWSEASSQLSHQPPPPPPSFSVNSSNLQSSCSSGTAVGVRDTRSLHTVTKGRRGNV